MFLFICNKIYQYLTHKINLRISGQVSIKLVRECKLVKNKSQIRVRFTFPEQCAKNILANDCSKLSYAF